MTLAICTMRGNSDHRPLHLWLNINCTFAEPQHIVVTRNMLPTFKYDQSKVEKYQLALTTSLGNLWVITRLGIWGQMG
jgi:hypothetical protein